MRGKSLKLAISNARLIAVATAMTILSARAQAAGLFSSFQDLRAKCEGALETLSEAGDKVAALRSGLTKKSSLDALAARVDELNRHLGARDPFGVKLTAEGNFSQSIADVFKRQGVDWNFLNKLDRKLTDAGHLSLSEWNQFSEVSKRAIEQAKSPLPSDDASKSVQRILFRRLLDMSAKIPQFGGGASGDSKSQKKSSQKNADAKDKEEKSQQKVKTEKDGTAKKETTDKKTGKKSGEENLKAEKNPENQESNQTQDSQKLSAGNEKAKAKSSVINPAQVPNDKKQQFEYVSDSLLRFLLRWELRKYDSARDIKDGLQSYFNRLENLSGRLESSVLNIYKNLSLGQIDRLTTGALDHESLGELVLQLQSAQGAGDTEKIYERTQGLLRILSDLEKYEILSPDEMNFSVALQRLSSSVQADGPPGMLDVVHHFHRQLIGDLSRELLREEFGPSLLQEDSLAAQKFYDAITSGSLWTYRYMGLLRAYLGVQFRPTYVYAPYTTPYGDFSAAARGMEDINRTDDLSFFSDFLPFDHPLTLKLDLAEGMQPFFQRRHPKIDPEESRAAAKKVSFIATDVSTSMDTRALIRNMLEAAYIDHHTSELKPLTEESEEEFVASHIIYRAPFTDHLGEIDTIETRAKASQVVKSLILTPQQNIQGETNLVNVLTEILDKIENAKAESSGDLHNATIYILTDGKDDKITQDDCRNLVKKIEGLGKDVQVNITVVYISERSEALIKMAKDANAKLRALGYGSSINHKFISDLEAKRILDEAKDLNTLIAPNSHTHISKEKASESERRALIRESVEDVAKTSVQLNRQTIRLDLWANEMKPKMLELFNPDAMPIPVGNVNMSSMRKIVGVLDLALPHFSEIEMSAEMRAGFLDRLVEELCAGEGMPRKVFEKALTDASFTKTRAGYQLWLEGK